ncbi:MAG: MOSC domain-containing protein [Desulfopila sp.]
MQQVKAISISDRKGIRKKNIDSVRLIADFGLENDAHGGRWHRQVSLLAEESIASMRDKGLQVVAGNFAENITTEGIDLSPLTVGTHLRIGESELIISQLGKICHKPCAIYHQAGDCVMPREGIFGVVHKEGLIRTGDTIEVLGHRSSSVALITTAANEKIHGDELRQLARKRWQPGFIRFDQLSDRQENLAAILDDLITTQQVSHILLFDPEGRHALALAGRPQDGPVQLHYCRTMDEIRAI